VSETSALPKFSAEQLTANINYLTHKYPLLADTLQLDSAHTRIDVDEIGFKHGDEYRLSIDQQVVSASPLSSSVSYIKQSSIQARKLRMAVLSTVYSPATPLHLAELIHRRDACIISSCLECFDKPLDLYREAHRGISRHIYINGSALLPFFLFHYQTQIEQKVFHSITISECNPAYLAFALGFFSFEALTANLQRLGVRLNLLFDNDIDILKDRFYHYYSAVEPLAVYALSVLNSPVRDPQLDELYSWIFSESGFGYRFRGAFGNSTDELNQFSNTYKNIRASSTSRWFKVNKNLIKTGYCALVGSGPSYETSKTDLQALNSHVVVFAAGSSLGSLLRDKVKVDYVVILERSETIFDDLSVLLNEGYRLDDINLIASITIDPRVPSLFASTTFYARPLSASVYLVANPEDKALPFAGPESLNAGIEVVTSLGLKNVLLFGADFAAIDPNLPRARQAYGYSDRIFDEPVIGNMGRTVYSVHTLLVSRDAFSSIINSFPELTVVRVGEGAQLFSSITNCPSLSPSFLKNVESVSSTDTLLEVSQFLNTLPLVDNVDSALHHVKELISLLPLYRNEVLEAFNNLDPFDSPSLHLFEKKYITLLCEDANPARSALLRLTRPILLAVIGLLVNAMPPQVSSISPLLSNSIRSSLEIFFSSVECYLSRYVADA